MRRVDLPREASVEDQALLVQNIKQQMMDELVARVENSKKMQ